MATDSYGRTVYEPGYDYDEVYRRRMQAINSNAQRENSWQQNQAALSRSRAEFDQAMNMRYAGLQSDAIGFNNFQSIADYGSDLQGRVNASANMFERGLGAGAGVSRFINAIGQQESGGAYGAVNKTSGALGKYQIMASNIASWSREALGRSVTPSQFLASPEIQERVARAKLAQYYNKYGPAGAAIAWYAGPAAAQRYVRTGRISTASQGAYPSIAAYVNQIMARMR